MEISPRRSLVLCMLLAGHSNEQIAKALGMSVGGIERIKRDKNFKQCLREAVLEIHSRAVGELSAGAIAAATRLRGILENQDTSNYHVILAARLLFDVIESARRWELEARLEKVEELLKLQNGDVNQPHNSQN
ncbi:hypothetical protein SD81_028530 [Tolypothrix campylonemoides VB511288]|nr:hypothetical protein SD81_028530 [Tolypothrix campylonemoides VB511288]